MVPPTLFCDTCGAANQPQASFCRTCGRTLQSAGAPSRNTATGRLLSNHLLKQRYRIIDAVGKGGMGAVYRAEDTQLGNRKVAVKEMSQSGLSPQEITEAANAFKQEAHILAGLQHPNLPNIYDHFSEAGRWYLVMSFIQGNTLADYLTSTRGGMLSVEEVLQIGIQLCTVLDYLHTQQPPIIFRDLKPSNVMRTKDGHLYLIDFGIARHFKPGQTKDTAAYGSMGHASPEQYGKAQTTPRSDIYSLGAVLHQLLSGHDPSTTPFRLPSLQSQVPIIPPELITLITQMLELDEGKRPTSIFGVKQKLQSVATVPSHRASPLIPPTVAVGKLPISTSALVSIPPISPTVLSSANTRKKGHQRAVLVSLLVVIIAVSGGAFIVSTHQASSNNNPGQTQLDTPTALPTPTATPTALPSTPYPQLASTYRGTMYNSDGQTATLTFTSIIQNQGKVSGNVIIGPGLTGSGPFTGTVGSDGSVSITDTPTDGTPTIFLSGLLHADGSLGGTYTIPSANQGGTWQTKSSS